MDYNEDRWGFLFGDDDTGGQSSMTQDFLENRKASVLTKEEGTQIVFQNIGNQK